MCIHQAIYKSHRRFNGISNKNVKENLTTINDSTEFSPF